MSMLFNHRAIMPIWFVVLALLALAEYKAGVLTVRLPLREDAKPKQIKVQVAA